MSKFPTRMPKWTPSSVSFTHEVRTSPRLTYRNPTISGFNLNTHKTKTTEVKKSENVSTLLDRHPPSHRVICRGSESGWGPRRKINEPGGSVKEKEGTERYRKGIICFSSHGKKPESYITLYWLLRLLNKQICIYLILQGTFVDPLSSKSGLVESSCKNWNV